ncbi:MAG: hypothetical protein IKO57_00275 [Treponema sp.]|nr:hypothetical protein [Treponema sp.]MBR4628869.1 hypothetical protein [Treponema sp.]MBR6914550.1 hypothetical protein [Treponema sp.]
MNTVKINLEYGAFPVWVYDSEGNLVDNDFPEYLMEDEELETAFSEIQALFDGLFIDDETEFRYIGFKSDGDKAVFDEKLENSRKLLQSKLAPGWGLQVLPNLQNLK